MSLTPWRKLRETILDENPYWKYMLAMFLSPDEKETEFYYIETTGAAVIVGVRDDGKIPLVRQFRPLFNKVSLEFPAGRIEVYEGADPAIGAAREFAEEAKMKAGHLELVGIHEPSASIVHEQVYVYVATELSPVASGQDSFEEFEELAMTPEEIDGAIARREITNGIIIAAWCQARPYVVDFLAKKR